MNNIAFENTSKYLTLICFFMFLILNWLAAEKSIVLFLDGAFYLFQVLQQGKFVFIEPTSRTVAILQQLPVVLALWSGQQNLEMLMFVSGFSNLMLPLLLTLSCYWILPKGNKGFMLFPLAHYLMGTMSSWFPTVTDAPPAAAYFWVLFYLILFRAEIKKWFLFTVLVALPALYLHESMSFLSLFLVAALLVQMKKVEKRELVKGYLLLVFWFLYVAYFQLTAILMPRHLDNKSGFLTVLREGKWIFWDGLNVPVLLSLFGAFSLLLVLFLNLAGVVKIYPKVKIWAQWIALILLISAITLVWAAMLNGEVRYGIYAQFAARAQAAFVSVPLATLVFVLLHIRSGQLRWKDPMLVAVVFFLAVGVFGSHLIGLAVWSRYLDDFGWILRNYSGFVPYQKALCVLPADRAIEFKRLSSGWTNPILSYFLSPQGEVTTLIGVHPTNHWQPFDPCDPSQVPTGKFNVRPYLKNLEENGCSSFEQNGERVPFLSDVKGLSHRENWGRWSKAKDVIFEFDRTLPRNLVVELEAQAFGPNVGQHFVMVVGEKQVNFILQSAASKKNLLFENIMNADFIKISVPHPVSPKFLDMGNDSRQLGIGLRSLNIYDGKNSPWIRMDFSKLEIYK